MYYHLGGGAVLVGLVQVTLAVMGLHQAAQLPVQCQVRDVICGKDQQVIGLLPPANPFL